MRTRSRSSSAIVPFAVSPPSAAPATGAEYLARGRSPERTLPDGQSEACYAPAREDAKPAECRAGARARRVPGDGRPDRPGGPNPVRSRRPARPVGALRRRGSVPARGAHRPRPRGLRRAPARVLAAQAGAGTRGPRRRDRLLSRHRQRSRGAAGRRTALRGGRHRRGGRDRRPGSTRALPLLCRRGAPGDGGGPAPERAAGARGPGGGARGRRLYARRQRHQLPAVREVALREGARGRRPRHRPRDPAGRGVREARARPFGRRRLPPREGKREAAASTKAR